LYFKNKINITAWIEITKKDMFRDLNMDTEMWK
jgi:hypothetical protein